MIAPLQYRSITLAKMVFLSSKQSKLGSKCRFCPLPALLEPNSFASTLTIESLDILTSDRYPQSF